ncbi:MAG: hypothetical protein ACRC6K_04620 [Fusobacteriaceae bacterium]
MIIFIFILLGILSYIIKPELVKRYSNTIENVKENKNLIVNYSNQTENNKLNENLETNIKSKDKIKIYENEYKNIVYATILNEEKNKQRTEKKMSLNIYRPLNTDELTPAIVYINGKNWSFEKEHIENNFFYSNLKKLREKGITVIDIEYRDVNEAFFPNQIYDVKGAIRFIKANAKLYGIIPEKISAIGVGTGATLALLLGTTSEREEFEGNIGGNKEYKSNVDSVISFGAVTDLMNISQDFNNQVLSKELAVKRFDGKDAPEAQLINFNTDNWQGMKGIRALKKEKQTKSYFWNRVHLTEMASPLYYVDNNSAPTFVVHGLLNRESPIKQSLKLVDAFIKSNVENIYVSDSKGQDGSENVEVVNLALEWARERLNGRKK